MLDKLKSALGHVLTALVSVALSYVITTTVNVNIVTNINKVEQKVKLIESEQKAMKLQAK